MSTHTFNTSANFTALADAQLSGSTVILHGDFTGSGTATASSNYTDQPAANAFDNDTAVIYASGTNTPPHWVQYDFGAGVAHIVDRYRFYSSGSHLPTNWTLQGSADASTWVTLDTHSSVAMSTYTWYEYEFANDTAYRYYRIYVTATTTGWLHVREMELLHTVGSFLVHDYGSLLLDSGEGMAFDNSTAAASSTLTASYQFADCDAAQAWTTAAEADAGAAWNGAWLSLAELRAAATTNKRYRYLKCRISGSTTGVYSSFSIGDYAADLTPPAAPTTTKFSLFEQDNYALIWTEPESDFDHCELRRDVDGVTAYLVVNSSGLPEWAASGTPISFADGSAAADLKVSNFVDEDVAGDAITYYVRAVDAVGNAGAWTAFGAGEAADPPATPTLAVLDAGDGSGATATITGSDSGTGNTVYCASAGTTAWVAVGERVGDGEVTLTLEQGQYWAKSESAGSGGVVTSNVALFWVTEADASPGEVSTYLEARLLEDAKFTGLLATAEALYRREPPRRAEFPAAAWEYAHTPDALQEEASAYGGTFAVRVYAADPETLDAAEAELDRLLLGHVFTTTHWACRRLTRRNAATTVSDLRSARGEAVLLRELPYELRVYLV